jgi:predicted nucleic acid-binding protein
MIVVDANVIIYAVRETPWTPLVRQVYARDSDWVVPALWEAEVLNGLLREVRAGSLDLDAALQAASSAAALLAGGVRGCDYAAVLRTAESEKLTAYDACYVVLARSLGVTLVTEDGRILAACPDIARCLRRFLGLSDGGPVVREARPAYRTSRRRQAKR